MTSQEKNRRLRELTARCQRNQGASPNAIHQLDQIVELPQEYLSFLRESDGLEGFVGVDAYVMLWSAREIPQLNKQYAVSEFAPGITLIGTNGGDTGYGVASIDGTLQFIEVPLVGMSLEVVKPLGLTFLQFLERVAAG